MGFGFTHTHTHTLQYFVKDRSDDCRTLPLDVLGSFSTNFTIREEHAKGDI